MADVHELQGRRRLREQVCPEAIDRLGRGLLAGCLLDPTQIPKVLEVMDTGDLRQPKHQTILKRMAALSEEGRAIDFQVLVHALDEAGELGQVGGLEFIGAVADAECTAVYAVEYARRLHRAHLEAHLRYAHERAAEEHDPQRLQQLQDEVRDLNEELDTEDSDPLADLLTGPSLKALRDLPEEPSPLPGLLDPRPGLVMVVGKPKVAKTSLLVSFAQAWCCGVSPWPGAPKLPGTRAVIVSAEQPAVVVDALGRRMDVCSEAVERDTWTERLTLIARYPDAPPGALRMLTLDDDGRRALRNVLRAYREAGDPIGFVVLDSLSRLKPADIEENDNDGMSQWLGSLQELAESEQVYLALIHHQGHSDREEANNAGRGASAIHAVAQVSWVLQTSKNDPRQRKLRVMGNCILDREMSLEVAPEGAEPGSVLYFRPCDPLDHYHIDELLHHGEQLSTRDLARRIEDTPPEQNPTGGALRDARQLRERWERGGLVEVVKGPRNAKNIQRVSQ